MNAGNPRCISVMLKLLSFSVRKLMLPIALVLVCALSQAVTVPQGPSALASEAYSCDELDLRSFLVRNSWELINQYWDCMDVLYRIKDVNEETTPGVDLAAVYRSKMDLLRKKAYTIAGMIISDLEKGDKSSLEAFSAFYGARKIYERQPLYLVAEHILAAVKSGLHLPDGVVKGLMKNLGRSFEQSGELFQKEYFPGYGESDPKYWYRKGRELESVTEKSYWKEEKKTIQSYERCSIEVALDLVHMLEESDSVEDLYVSAPYVKMVDGKEVKVVKANFLTKAVMTVTTKKLYNSDKVWFELFRSLQNPYHVKWERCGKTYEIHEFYGHEEVISQSF